MRKKGGSGPFFATTTPRRRIRGENREKKGNSEEPESRENAYF